jgi:hypothetical protein
LSKLTKAEVNYRKAEVLGRACGRCTMFLAPESCTLVKGYILRSFVCDRFEPKDHRNAERS